MTQTSKRFRRRAVFVAAAIGLLAAALLAINTVISNAETKPATPDIGRVLDLPGGDLQVREDGPRDTPPVVLLHCFACSMKWWNPVVGELALRNRVIRIDLLGHGGSEKPDGGYDMESQARQVALALKELGVDHAIVAGHSMGGTVATALAAQEPSLVAGVVIVSTEAEVRYGRLPLTARLGFLPVVGQAINSLLPDSMIRNAYADVFQKGFEVPGYVVDDFRSMTYTSYDDSARLDGEYTGERPLQERLAATRIPLMVIQGTADRLVDPAVIEAWREVPGVRIEPLPGVGHSPPIEEPAKVASLLAEFSADLTPGVP